MEFKTVKNTVKPGRPPSGCVWVKDAAGKLVTNDQGQLAFRKATAEDIKPKKAGRGKRGKGKAAAKAKVMKERNPLLLKKTYKDLSSADLEKISAIAGSLVQAAKDTEKRKLESSIAKMQQKLNNL